MLPARTRSTQLGIIDDLMNRCRELAAMDFEFLYDTASRPAGHRLRRGRTAPRSVLLRPAGIGSAPGQFSAHRAGAGAAEALVLARPPADQSWRRREPDFVERLDVRVPHAAADHAELREHPAGADLQGRGVAPDRIRPATRACPGAFPSPATTPPTCTRSISTGRSACPGWASSAGWETTWSSRPTPAHWR